MRIVLYLVIFSYSICLFSQTPPDTLWTKTFGENDWNEYGVDFQKTADNGFILIGDRNSWGLDSSDIILIKIEFLQIKK